MVGTGNDWGTTYLINATLTGGVTNYLHVIAENEGGPDAFIGSFHLEDNLFKFANGTAFLVTDLVNWTAAVGAGTFAGDGWFAPGDTPISLGLNGVAPWGSHSLIDIGADAQWIWRSPDTQGNGDLEFFSTAITPVAAQTPLPGALPLFAAGMGGLGLLARRKRRT